jgi:hypothetical protein
MGTTTNNGWTYPESTDLVKDGATAIQTLADDIDTTLGVYADPGLVLLNTTSFSAVASQSVNDVFSSTYDNYRIVCEFSSSTDQEIFFRLRASGADLTSNVYRIGQLTIGVGIANAFAIASINVAQIQQATAYTGFTLFCTAATTITGTVRTYGYNQ